MLTCFLKKLTGIKHLLLLISFGSSLITYTNAQEIEWQNTIGGDKYDGFSSIQQTADGGYILGGSSYSWMSGDKTEHCFGLLDYWIVKTDPLGNIQWENTIGGSSDDKLNSIQQTADGGYILGGASKSNISYDKTENNIDTIFPFTYDYWIVKTDASGNIQWQNTIGGSADERLHSIRQTADGGYILGGYSESNISGDKSENSLTIDYWIVKTDSFGNIQWQNTIGGNLIDYLYHVQQTIDGGYILGGVSGSNISGDKTENCVGGNADLDYWIVKTDASGNIQWQNTIGGNMQDWLYCIQQTTDGGYIIGGDSWSSISGDKTENANGGSKDYWIIKTDSSGNIQWQNTIGGISSDEAPYVQQTMDGGYIIGGGSSGSNISGDKTENNIGGAGGFSDYWIVKTDVSGNIQWQNIIGGNGSDFYPKIQQTNDGGYILGGNSESNISGDKTENNWDTVCNPLCSSDFWIVKLTENYNLITGTTFLDLNSNSSQDIGEPSLTNKTITEQNTGRFAFSQPNGFYSVAVLDSGSFNVTPSPMSYYTAMPVSHIATFTSTNQTDSLNDFAFQPIGAFNDLCVTITPLGVFRPGFDASYMVNYENVGTTALNGTIKLFQDNVLSYVSSTLPPFNANTDSIEWNIGTLTPFQTGGFVVTFTVSSSAVLGSNLISQCVIEPFVNDANTACNFATDSSIVTGSYDPNDILVSEDALTTIQLATQPYLDYTIRFQNTGNDTAFTVKIINPIDTNKLELSSIEFVNSSHPVQLKWVNYNRNMEFLFDNILLPDSNVNEPLSHGFVHYRIKPKTTLLAGDSITNKAYIYFDFNAPVETNTAVTKIVLPTGLTPNPSPKERGALLCYPNPTKDELNIQLNQPKSNQPITISIYDVLGNEILKKQSATVNCKLPTVNFSSGLYFVEVKTGKEIYRAKFVKE